MDDRGRSRRRAVGRLAIGGLAGALLMVLGFAPSALAAPVSHFSINNASVTEGDAGTANLTFSISYTGTKNDISVDWATADGTATAPADYTASSGTATFTLTGAKSQTITIPVAGDLLDEANETFTVNLTNPQPPATADITTATGTGTIKDDDPTPSIVIDDVSLAEGDAGTTNADFTVMLSAPSGRNVTVKYATANSTAVQPSDYATTSGTLTFTPGEIAMTVSVLIAGDTTDENDEAFFVNLSGQTNSTIADNRGVGTIVNDDAPPSLSINDVSRTEGNSGTANMTFTATLSAASGKTVTVAYATTDDTATAPGDYSPTTGTLTFNPGVSTRTFNVPIVGDTLDEDDETFFASLSSPVNATIADGLAVGTILDNDASPTLSINNVTVTEVDMGSVTATFTVTLSKVSGRSVAVDYATSDVTASAPTDYIPVAGTLLFPPGTTTQTIPITVDGDLSDEPDETYRVTLSNPVNASITAAIGTGTITDNDAAPTVSISNASIAEGDTGAATVSLTVSLSVASGKPIDVSYASADATAVAPGDYSSVSGTLSFAPGRDSTTVDVAVAGDATYEYDETFSVTLSAPVNATLGTTTAFVTIVNDDPLPEVSIDDRSVTEGDAGTTIATFTVSLSNPSAFPISVAVATSDQSATAPADYSPVATTLSFAPGEDSKTVDVPVEGDVVYEVDETYAVDLTGPVGAALADAAGAGTIVDDDAAPVLDVGDVTVTEGDAGDVTASFPVTLMGATEVPATVDVVTADDSASDPSDYAAVTSSLTFAVGQTSRAVDVLVHGDTTFELDETFRLHLSNAVGATIGIDPGLGTILNDDAIPGIAVDDVSLPEGDVGDAPATFTIAIDGPSAFPITVDVATLDGTATRPSDYDAVATSLTFAPGEITKTVDVTIHGDTLFEPDETYTVQLSNATGAGISDGLGGGVIVGDDLPTAPPANGTASIGDASVAEGDAGTTTTLSFPVTLSTPAPGAVTIDYRTTDGSATEGSDYVEQLGHVTIPPGETKGSVDITVSGDDVIEPDETFSLEITAVNGARRGTDGTGTIANDDRQVTNLILRAEARHHHVVSRGRMLHAEPGMRVRVVLLRLTGDGYLPIARTTLQVHVRSGGGVPTGVFTARFTHQRSGRYVVRATYRGDETHLPSHARARVRL